MPNVGRLEPGAAYIYEKADGITYARKMGDPPESRIEIGRDYHTNSEPSVLGMPLKRVAKLIAMEEEAEHNPALQDALDRAKVIYELSRQDQTVNHHPV